MAHECSFVMIMSEWLAVVLLMLIFWLDVQFLRLQSRNGDWLNTGTQRALTDKQWIHQCHAKAHQRYGYQKYDPCSVFRRFRKPAKSYY